MPLILRVSATVGIPKRGVPVAPQRGGRLSRWIYFFCFVSFLVLNAPEPAFAPPAPARVPDSCKSGHPSSVQSAAFCTSFLVVAITITCFLLSAGQICVLIGSGDRPNFETRSSTETPAASGLNGERLLLLPRYYFPKRVVQITPEQRWTFV